MKDADRVKPPAGPVRTCLGCGARSGQAELLRFVLRGGELLADQNVRQPGRGVYCCRREACLKRFAARKARLAKALRREVNDCREVEAILATRLEHTGVGNDEGQGIRIGERSGDGRQGTGGQAHRMGL